jgi:pyruvate kinase
MTKILATVGPVSSDQNLKYLIDRCDMVRLNMSHNSIDWHKRNINKIKKINSNKYVLVDIPGAKPRTLNINSIRIKKGQKVIFAHNNKSKNIIPISNPLPKLTNKKEKTFSISDGSFIFKFISLKNKKLEGISLQDFILLPKKGINIPYSVYDDNYQSKVYTKFIKKINGIKFDCIGLSFVQNSKIIKTLKKKNKSKIFISKIENYLGYINRKEIINESDAIMIDRGDLAAEIGNDMLTEFSSNIIEDCKKNGKPIIIATENLNSLITNLTPSKSDILNLDYYLLKKVDYLMLSDETATSNNWKNTLRWVKNYLILKTKKDISNKLIDVSEIVKTLSNYVLVVFSKKGFIYKNVSSNNYLNLILFTENKILSKVANLKDNVDSFFLKFPKKNIDKFLYRNIKQKKKLIFKDNNKALLVNVTFPRKNSRANTLIILSKKDF